MDATPEAAEDSRSKEDRPVVLVAFEPRSYREAIGGVIRALRPRLKVRVVEPDELGAEVAHLDPELVLCSQPNTFTTSGRPSWLEFSPYDKPTAQICVGGQRSELEEEVELDDLLSLVDREAAPSTREGARGTEPPSPSDPPSRRSHPPSIGSPSRNRRVRR
jgi:hypothetical protein